MAALIVVNGHATVTMTMSNDDLRHLMDDVTARSWTGQGFWATSGPHDSTGPKALWVPPGSIVQFQFDPGHTWDQTSMPRQDRRSVEEDETGLMQGQDRRSVEEDETGLMPRQDRRSVEEDETGLMPRHDRRSMEEDETVLRKVNLV